MLSSSELASVCRELDKNANSRWGDRNRDMDVEGERERESQRERDIGREMSRDMGRRRISSSAGWSDSPPRNLKLIGAQKGDRSSRQSSKQSSVRRILQFNRVLSIDQGQGGFRNDEKDSYNGNYNGYNGGDKNNLNSSCKDLESIGNSGNYSGNLSGNYSGNLSGNSVGNIVASSVASSIVKRGHSILDNLASLVSSRRSSGALEPLAEEQIRTPTRYDSQLIDGDFFDQISNVLKNLNAVSESEKHSAF